MNFVKLKKPLFAPCFLIIVLLLSTCVSNPGGELFSSKVELNPALSGTLLINYLVSDSDSNTWISRAITDYLISELSDVEELTIISRDDLDAIMDEQSISLAGLTDKEVEIGKLLSADTILKGKYSVQNSRLLLNMRLIDSVSSKILYSFYIDEPINMLPHIQSKLLFDFYEYAGIPINMNRLAAKDYPVTKDDLNLYYRAEELYEAGRKDDSLSLIDILTSQNSLFTPAVELKNDIKGIANVSGKKIINNLDQELRNRYLYANQFINLQQYLYMSGYDIKIKEFTFDTPDGKDYVLGLKVAAVLKEDASKIVRQFIENNPYFGLGQHLGSRDDVYINFDSSMPNRGTFQIRADDNMKKMLGNDELRGSDYKFGDSYYSLSFLDEDNSPYWILDFYERGSSYYRENDDSVNRIFKDIEIIMTDFSTLLHSDVGYLSMYYKIDDLNFIICGLPRRLVENLIQIDLTLGMRRSDSASTWKSLDNAIHKRIFQDFIK